MAKIERERVVYFGTRGTQDVGVRSASEYEVIRALFSVQDTEQDVPDAALWEQEESHPPRLVAYLHRERGEREPVVVWVAA